MASRKHFALAMLGLLVGLAVVFLSIAGSISKRTYPQSSNFPFLSIHELRQLNPTSGRYNTEGYVAKIFTCPPCPSGALCKPCMRDNIVISEQRKTIETYTLTEMDLIVFVNHPDQFTIGKKYTFSIQISQNHSTGDSINDLELAGYSP